MANVTVHKATMLPTRKRTRFWPGFLRMSFLLAILAVAGPAWANEAGYAIEVNSPEHWSDYYSRTGLGEIDAVAPHSELADHLTAHCGWLTEHTDHKWLPLGYSAFRGVRVCFPVGPFSLSEAEMYCERLGMKVKENRSRAIVCGGKWEPVFGAAKTNRGTWQ